MTTVTTLPGFPSQSRPLTVDDLDGLPTDDGRRYELIDGVLFVSPGPELPHQDVVGNLYLLMRAACPPDLKVVLAPFSVILARDTEVQPDLLVARRDQLTRTHLPGPPLLAVEVLSPSTRRYDQLLKRDRFQSGGIAAYWLIDPQGPTVTVLELRGDTYAQVAQVTGPEAVELTQPFPVRLVPAELLDD